MDLESSLSNYDQMLANYDPQGKSASSPTQRAAIEGAYTDLQMKLKTLYELGAPQAGDLKLLAQSIPSPVDMNGTIRGAAFGAEPFKVEERRDPQTAGQQPQELRDPDGQGDPCSGWR